MPDSEKKQKPDENVSFETGIQELEKIIARLEQGEISLDESFTLYQQGVSLSKKCSQQLQEMEQKIQIVSLNSDEDDLISDFSDADSVNNL